MTVPDDPLKLPPSRPDHDIGRVETASGRPASDDAALSRARRPYLAKLAHELKTPLTAIVSASEIMRDEQLGPLGDARYREYSADIHRTAQHALDVINRMMALRRVEGPSVEPVRHITEIKTEALLANVASSMAPIFHRAGLHFETVIAKDLPRLIADEVQIRQVLFNLLTNAVKFTPLDGSVILKAQLTDASGLSISVRDAGQGMSDVDIQAVYSASRPTPGQSGGHALGQERVRKPGEGSELGQYPDLKLSLGLGLPLVFQLVAENGGAVSIISPPQGAPTGTCVSATFPNDRLVFI
ncbi:MAG: HAMP domain-containing sensor histidine kinase [Pseudomonadota bacterium]